MGPYTDVDDWVGKNRQGTLRWPPLDIQGGLGRCVDEKLFISRLCEAKIFFSHFPKRKVYMELGRKN